MNTELHALQARIKEAIDVVSYIMTTDGEHHKVWALDTVVQILANEDYDNVVQEFEAETGAEWDRGIEP